MVKNKAPRSSSPHFSVPGKVFILGEYAALAGRPSVIAALGPRFELSAERKIPTAGWTEFHPASPAGRLLEFARLGGVAEVAGAFRDPHEGAGGFGASSAQFALLYRAMAADAGWDLAWKSVWKLFRELTSGDGDIFPPSGADLVAQWEGGVMIFEPRRPEGCETVSGSFPWSQLLVFSAARQPGRKVETHRHLNELARAGFPQPGFLPRLEAELDRGIAAIRGRDPAGLGRALNAYTELLAGAELEARAAREDREALARLPGVLGVKGSGAMQADALIALVDSESAKQAVLAAARARGLEPLGEGLVPERGIHEASE